MACVGKAETNAQTRLMRASKKREQAEGGVFVMACVGKAETNAQTRLMRASKKREQAEGGEDMQFTKTT